MVLLLSVFNREAPPPAAVAPAPTTEPAARLQLLNAAKMPMHMRPIQARQLMGQPNIAVPAAPAAADAGI
jgi:hypothetical protein